MFNTLNIDYDKPCRNLKTPSGNPTGRCRRTLCHRTRAGRTHGTTSSCRPSRCDMPSYSAGPRYGTSRRKHARCTSYPCGRAGYKMKMLVFALVLVLALLSLWLSLLMCCCRCCCRHCFCSINNSFGHPLECMALIVAKPSQAIEEYVCAVASSMQAVATERQIDSGHVVVIQGAARALTAIL